MSHLIVWLLVGGATGWVTSVVARATIQHTVLNLTSGMAGAAMTGWVMLPVLGVSTLPQSASHFSLASIAVALAGALMLLTLAHLLRPDSPR